MAYFNRPRRILLGAGAMVIAVGLLTVYGADFPMGWLVVAAGAVLAMMALVMKKLTKDQV